MLEIEILQSDIKDKEKLLDVIEDENKFLKEELKSAKDDPRKLLDYFQKEGPVYLSEELSNTCQLVKTFECTFGVNVLKQETTLIYTKEEFMENFMRR